jgi:hypothetical protein
MKCCRQIRRKTKLNSFSVCSACLCVWRPYVPSFLLFAYSPLSSLADAFIRVGSELNFSNDIVNVIKNRLNQNDHSATLFDPAKQWVLRTLETKYFMDFIQLELSNSLPPGTVMEDQQVSSSIMFAALLSLCISRALFHFYRHAENERFACFVSATDSSPSNRRHCELSHSEPRRSCSVVRTCCQCSNTAAAHLSIAYSSIITCFRFTASNACFKTADNIEGTHSVHLHS